MAEIEIGARVLLVEDDSVTRETMRERGRPVPPSCAVSAHARDVDRRRAIEAGFDLYITKPVSPECLIEAVSDLREILGRAESPRPPSTRPAGPQRTAS